MAESSTAFQEWTSAWLQAVVKAWNDPAFKARLLQDPRGALGDFAYQLPASIELHVIDLSEDPDKVGSPASSFDLATFTGGVDVKLSIPLPVAPQDLSERIVILTRPASPSLVHCVCVCC